MSELRDMLQAGVEAAAVLHSLPYRGPGVPVPGMKFKAQVFKNHWGWCWRHTCRYPFNDAVEMGFRDWALAYSTALRHLERCTG